MNPDQAKNKTEPAEKKQDYVRASYSLKRKIVDLVSNGRILAMTLGVNKDIV